MWPHSISGKAQDGGNIFCRQCSIAQCQDREPEWPRLGPLGTDGVEGETAEQDNPETWGWALPDVILQTAAAGAHPLMNF